MVGSAYAIRDRRAGPVRAGGQRPQSQHDKRAIQRLLQNPLALAVLEGKFSEGDHIVVDRDPKGELTFRKAKEPALAGR